MKLDPRIKSIDFIRCFNTNNYDCLGKFGYFTKFVENFDDLDKIRKGVCGFKDGSCFPFYEGDQSFQFFIPEFSLKPKEKNYRPYTLNEFLDKYTVCANIRIRQRDRTYQYFGKLIGYGFPTDPNTGKQNGDNDAIVCIGGYSFKLTELFTDYEQYDNMKDIWVPCGVEVEE